MFHTWNTSCVPFRNLLLYFFFFFYILFYGDALAIRIVIFYLSVTQHCYCTFILRLLTFGQWYLFSLHCHVHFRRKIFLRNYVTMAIELHFQVTKLFIKFFKWYKWLSLFAGRWSCFRSSWFMESRGCFRSSWFTDNRRRFGSSRFMDNRKSCLRFRWFLVTWRCFWSSWATWHWCSFWSCWICLEERMKQKILW